MFFAKLAVADHNFEKIPLFIHDLKCFDTMGKRILCNARQLSICPGTYAS